MYVCECECVCHILFYFIFFTSSFTYRIDGPSVAPALSAYKSAYGLSSSYYSSPKVAITPAVSKVIAAPAVYSSGHTLGVAPTISATYSSAPAVSSYYSANNKLAYSTPSLIKQVSYATAAPPLQYVSPTLATAHGAAYGLGIAKAAYSVAPAAKYVSTAYTNPAAITSSYVAANKFAYTGPNVATQYAASYTPNIAASYVSAPIAKQVSYATNPLLTAGGSAAYVSGYKTGAAYVAPASIATLGGAGIVKTAGYTSSLGYILVLIPCFLLLKFAVTLFLFLIPFRYTPAQTVVATPGHLSTGSYLAGTKLVSNAGLAGAAVYPATVAHNGYVSASGIHGAGAASGLLHSGIVSSAGYYGAGSKLIAGNGLYAGHGIYSTAHGGLHGNGLLASTSGLRFVAIFKVLSQ